MLRWLSSCFGQSSEHTPLLAPPAPAVPKSSSSQPTAAVKPLAALSSLLGYGKTEACIPSPPLTPTDQSDVLTSPRRRPALHTAASDVSDLEPTAEEEAARALEQAKIEQQIRQGSVASLYANRMQKLAPQTVSAYRGRQLELALARRGSADSSGVGSPTLKTPVLITPQRSREFEYDNDGRVSSYTDQDGQRGLIGLGLKPPVGFSQRYAAPPLPPVPPVDAGIAQMLFNVESRRFTPDPSPTFSDRSEVESESTERGRSRQRSPITASADDVVYKSIGLAGLGSGSSRKKQKRNRVVTPRTS